VVAIATNDVYAIVRARWYARNPPHVHRCEYRGAGHESDHETVVHTSRRGGDTRLPASTILPDQRHASSRDFAACREAHEVDAGRNCMSPAVGAIPAHTMKAPLTRATFQPPHEPA